MRAIKLLIFSILIFSATECFPQDVGNKAKPKPFTFHGSIGLNLMAYAVDGIPARQLPFSYLITANATATIYGIELPFSFVYSNRQKSYAQPFNQFGLSARWKWITLHGGYRNVTFSEFTLAGHTFLGGGIELTPSIFRFGFVYGRFDRKTTTSPVFETDSLPRFKRKGFAVKLGVGTENNHFDLLFLRIRDDSSSIEHPDTGAYRFPEQNVVAGFSSRFTFFKKLTWETEAAVSLYTTDMSAKPSLDSTSPSILLNLNNFFVINQSSEYYMAIRSSLKFKSKSWSLKLEYKRIDPRYRSMGAYYFNNDVENLTLSPSFTLLKRKLSVSGSVGLQRDNLKGSKRATSLRTIGNVNVSFNPSYKFGLDINYGNFGISQSAGRLPLNDTIKVSQTTHNLSVMPRLMFMDTKKSHMIFLVYSMAMFYDQNKFTSAITYFESHTGQLNYTLGLIESKWSFTFGLSYASFSTCLSDNTGTGGTFGLSKLFFKDKLSLNWNNSLTRSVSDAGKGWILNSNLTSNYKVHKHHAIKLNVYFTGNYNDPGSINKSFNEIKGDLGYVYSF